MALVLNPDWLEIRLESVSWSKWPKKPPETCVSTSAQSPCTKRELKDNPKAKERPHPMLNFSGVRGVI